jgi:hypothetical protein
LRRLRIATLTLSDHQGLEGPLLQITVPENDARSAHLGLESINSGNGPLPNSEERAMRPGPRHEIDCRCSTLVSGTADPVSISCPQVTNERRGCHGHAGERPNLSQDFAPTIHHREVYAASSAHKLPKGGRRVRNWLRRWAARSRLLRWRQCSIIPKSHKKLQNCVLYAAAQMMKLVHKRWTGSMQILIKLL